MFYINPHSLLKRRESLLLHVLPTLVVFMAFFVVTISTWTAAKYDLQNKEIESLNQENSTTGIYLKQRMGDYEDILRGASGLVESNATTTREQWRTYLDSYQISTRYPGIQGVGYVPVVLPENLQAHQDKIRSEGFPDYKIFPVSDRDIYTSILYIEPFSGRNVGAIGFDMYSDPTRRAAMDKARDSGQATLSNTVTLIQESKETETNQQPGFLLYYPIYAPGVPTTKPIERQSALTGFAYAAFRANDLISNIVPSRSPNFAFRLTSANRNDNQMLYKSAEFDTLMSNARRQVASTDIQIAGSTWNIEGVVKPDIVGTGSTSRPSTLLWLGLLFSALLAGFIYMLLTNRSRALAEREEKDVQEAKDELLALASHQLRTPATGVKQYIGMLKDGLAGPVTADQQMLLEKAYESNERQLLTINEILVVARADAGQFTMKKESVEVGKLVKDIIDEQRHNFEKNEQELNLDITKKKLLVSGDKRYLRMALENVVSNATKYTYPKGRISITVKPNGKEIYFSVEDTGVGVAQKNKRLLFEKFSRIPNELTGKVSGTGIGLYLTRKIIDSHDGTIEFHSKPKKGSTIVIKLPKQNKSS